MCGIVTLYHPTKNVKTETLLRYYLMQRHRGHDGFGYTYLTKGGRLMTKRYEEEAACWHELSRVRSRMVMFHHRYPTSTANNAFQNHPIVLRTDKALYCMVHNGVIHNDVEIREDHFAERDFSTEEAKDEKYPNARRKFNDSEALLHDLVDHIENGTDLRARGSIAFILMEADPKTGAFRRFHYGRNTNPLLHCIMPSGLNVMSSENDLIPLKDQEKYEVIPDKLHTFTPKARGRLAIESRALNFPVYTPPKKSTAGYQTPATATPSAHAYDDADDWNAFHRGEYVGNGVGTGFNPPPVRHVSKKKDKSERAEKFEAYMDTWKLSKALVEEAKYVDPKTPGAELRCDEVLMEIDEAVRELTSVSIAMFGRLTREPKKTLDALGVQRRRIVAGRIKEVVPPAASAVTRAIQSMWPGKTHSIFDKLREGEEAHIAP